MPRDTVLRAPAWQTSYLAAIVPLLTIHLAFFTSAAEGYIDWCIPYWSDCVSISRSGRHGTAYYLFKGGMIPATVLLGFFWHACGIWVSQFSNESASRIARAGWIASLSLLVYTLALGHAGDSFRLLRRFGVVLFMGLTFIVQVRIGNALQKSPGYVEEGTNLLRFSAAILLIAISSLFIDYWLEEDYARIENAFEWWLIVLLIVHLGFIARIVRKHQHPGA